MFTLKSFVFSCFSPGFYAEAVKRSFGKALLVFTLLITIATLINTAIFGVGAFRLNNKIKNDETFFDGLPDRIIVKDNTLTVVGLEMPFVYVEDGNFLAIDTTGEITGFPDTYTEGFLLTKHEVIVQSKDSNGIQRMSYDDILKGMEKSEINVTKDDMGDLLNSFITVGMCVYPFVMFVWLFVTKFIGVLVIALIGTIILSIMKAHDPFRTSLIVATYSTIPTYYIYTIAGLIGLLLPENFGSLFTACCLLPLLIWLTIRFTFWGIGVYGVRNEKPAL